VTYDRLLPTIKDRNKDYSLNQTTENSVSP